MGEPPDLLQSFLGSITSVNLLQGHMKPLTDGRLLMVGLVLELKQIEVSNNLPTVTTFNWIKGLLGDIWPTDNPQKQKLYFRKSTVLVHKIGSDQKHLQACWQVCYSSVLRAAVYFAGKCKQQRKPTTRKRYYGQ